jgi:hypothetical protein
LEVGGAAGDQCLVIALIAFQYGSWYAENDGKMDALIVR